MLGVPEEPFDRMLSIARSQLLRVGDGRIHGMLGRRGQKIILGREIALERTARHAGVGDHDVGTAEARGRSSGSRTSPA